MQTPQRSQFTSRDSRVMLSYESMMVGQPIAYIAVPQSAPWPQQPRQRTMQEQQIFHQSQQPSQLRLPPPMPSSHGITKAQRKAFECLGALQIVVGLLSVAAETVALITVGRDYTVYAGIWCGVFFLITGSVAVSAAKGQSSGRIVAAMVLSIFTSVIFVSCQLSLALTFFVEDREIWPQTIHGLLMGLSGVEFFLSVSCAACSCRAVCRCSCCCCSCCRCESLSTDLKSTPATYDQNALQMPLINSQSYANPTTAEAPAHFSGTQQSSI